MNIWQDIKAWWRGERRVAGANRGRCYERKDGTIPIKTVPEMKCTSIKITRADGTVEEYK